MSAVGTPPTGPPAPAKPPAHCAWEALTALSASITASSGRRMVSASANSHSLRTAVHVSSAGDQPAAVAVGERQQECAGVGPILL